MNILQWNSIGIQWSNDHYWLYSIPINNLYYNKKNVKIDSLRLDKTHNNIIISIIFGTLLGNGTAEKSKIVTDGTRIIFYQEAMHLNYLLWLHKLFKTWNYCNSTLPPIRKKLSKKGKLLKYLRFETWYYSSFDWIYDIWYINGVKKVPHCISLYLTPLALSIWIMESAVKNSSQPNGGLNLLVHNNCFSYSDCLLLVQVLYDNFKLKAKIESTGSSKNYRICIPKSNMVQLNEIVSPYIIPSMKYKLLP